MGFVLGAEAKLTGASENGMIGNREIFLNVRPVRCGYREAEWFGLKEYSHDIVVRNTIIIILNAGMQSILMWQMVMKMAKKKGYRTRYAGSRGKGVVVVLPEDPRKGICEACGKSKHAGEIKVTALHHWWYAYKPATVKQNPYLVLENTSELCYGCHQVADAIRMLIYARPNRVANVGKLLEGVQLQRFLKTLEAVVESLRKTEKNINPLANKILKMIKDEAK